MTTITRNLILTALLLLLAVLALVVPGLDGTTRSSVVAGCLAFVTGLWLDSGRSHAKLPVS